MKDLNAEPPYCTETPKKPENFVVSDGRNGAQIFFIYHYDHHYQGDNLLTGYIYHLCFCVEW
jgi:hypothetical protein